MKELDDQVMKLEEKPTQHSVDVMEAKVDHALTCLDISQSIHNWELVSVSHNNAKFSFSKHAETVSVGFHKGIVEKVECDSREAEIFKLFRRVCLDKPLKSSLSLCLTLVDNERV